jgi:hypothetical protein
MGLVRDTGNIWHLAFILIFPEVASKFNVKRALGNLIGLKGIKNSNELDF